MTPNPCGSCLVDAAAALPANVRVMRAAVQRSAQWLALTPLELVAALQDQQGTLREEELSHALSPGTPQWCAACTLVQIAQLLYTQVGDNAALAARWIHAFNRDLDAAPAQLLPTAGGRQRVLGYLRRVGSADPV